LNSKTYGLILVASLAGGLTGALVTWNRKRSQMAGESAARRLAVLVLGTGASASAVVAFGQAFGTGSAMYGALVIVAVTGWVAVVRSGGVPLPVPLSLLKGRPIELAILGAPWTGVRLFGMLLRSSPLRHLGGRVFLLGLGRDPRAVLPGIYDAERIHWWALLASCPWLIWWGTQGTWMLITVALAVHLPLNAYPVLHLRYVSGRIERCLAAHAK
jgi:hypothetical protein